ncbi:hypothetical protein BDK51DRAFT_26576 [Blyttiomyces helicus]|uniref:Uncharacterized protein n=1 Tax=Blyttiomyces helicus TaxID=388810 RepID=A0A4P9WSD8_9FUNG|nr:hypothetical protein BDK51DRAFT_26576 [Blyttiomyces helicus]|eukprot:RKO94220.1 hypothetical protein BDK51DRAFT_26576 [Blyttiomyces helicus]
MDVGLCRIEMQRIGTVIYMRVAPEPEIPFIFPKNHIYNSSPSPIIESCAIPHGRTMPVALLPQLRKQNSSRKRPRCSTMCLDPLRLGKQVSAVTSPRAIPVTIPAPSPALNATDYNRIATVVVMLNSRTWPSPLDNLRKEFLQDFAGTLVKFYGYDNPINTVAWLLVRMEDYLKQYMPPPPLPLPSSTVAPFLGNAHQLRDR